jgi:hypothetical protein
VIALAPVCAAIKSALTKIAAADPAIYEFCAPLDCSIARVPATQVSLATVVPGGTGINQYIFTQVASYASKKPASVVRSQRTLSRPCFSWCIRLFVGSQKTHTYVLATIPLRKHVAGLTIYSPRRGQPPSVRFNPCFERVPTMYSRSSLFPFR